MDKSRNYCWDNVPRVLVHTGIKQGLVHTCIQVSLLNVSLYRKRFSFYRKVMTMEIAGLAIKMLPYNAVEKETSVFR
jgi:hypothetical protein